MTANLSCSITSTNYQIPLGVDIRLDGQTVLSVPHVIQPIDFRHAISDDPADHLWEIELKNKQASHTKIDSLGNIESDACLVITDFAVDGIQLGHLAHQISEYIHDFNGTGPESCVKFYDTMGCNGTVKLRFSTPCYQWLLENL